MSHIISSGRAVRVQSSSVTRIREGLTDISRTIEDLTWTNLSQDTRMSGIEDDWVRRADMLKRMRTMRRRSPLAKQSFQLLKNYCLGQGVTLRPNNKALIAKIVDEFWDDPVNQTTFTSHVSMIQALDTIFTDGDLFLVLFPDYDLGNVQLGWIDSSMVQDVVTDENNWRVAKWYKVRKPRGAYDFKTGAYNSTGGEDFVYYRDWRNTDEVESQPKGRKQDQYKPRAGQIAEGLIYHVAINKRGKFGESELAAASDWLKAHKDFMEDRATLSRAAAQIAWRKKRKGPASDIAAQVSRLQSSLVDNLSRWETNPPSASGSTIVENDGSTMEWVKTDTGAGNALMDERIIRMMVGSGVGVMNHYFGDEAAANLATATAMELPMLKMYEGWQKLLTDVIKDILFFVLTVAHEAGRIGPQDTDSKYKADQSKPPSILQALGMAPTVESNLIEAASMSVVTVQQPEAVDDVEDDTTGAIDWYVDVDFPPIVQREIGAYIAALKNTFSMMPVFNIESQKLVISMALTAFGVNDIDEVMSKLFSGDFSQATFAVTPIQQTGATTPGTLNPLGAAPMGPLGQNGTPGAQAGIPKQPSNAGSTSQPPQAPAPMGSEKAKKSA